MQRPWKPWSPWQLVAFVVTLFVVKYLANLVLHQFAEGTAIDVARHLVSIALSAVAIYLVFSWAVARDERNEAEAARTKSM